jgi:hypothetical protein
MLAQLVIACGLNLLGVAAVVAGYWYWDYSRNMLAAQQAELASLDQKITDLSQLKRVMAETANDRAKLGAYFVTTNTLPDFISDLENLATSTKVELRVTNVALETEPVSAVVLKFEVVGSFANLHRYIALINELPYQLVFDEALVAARDGWTGKFTLRVLSFIKE